jgi:hypothetical protein
MNHEVEAFEGELRQLRERELKLAKVVNACEEYMFRNPQSAFETSDADKMCILNLKRLVEDPAVANWMDRMRQTGKAPVRRFTDGTPPFGKEPS